MVDPVFPVAGPTSVTTTIPAYLYQEYNDDDDVAALVEAYNALAQQYLDWFNHVNLPVYTSTTISDSLLDWVAAGLYGITRPTLSSGVVQGIGLLDSFMLGQIVIGTYTLQGLISNYVTSDDTFKRIITWHFFKGDGFYFCFTWLKRRIMRFLIGTAGTAPNIDHLYPISVVHASAVDVTVTITLTTDENITLLNAQLFQAAVQSGVLELPFQFSLDVVIVNNLGPTNLISVAGVLTLIDATGWATSAAGLPPGALWSDSGVVTIVPGVTPNPFAAPIFFGLITSATLKLLGGGNLPLGSVTSGSGQIWNDSNVAKVA